MTDDFKDVSGLLEDDRSKIDDKVTIGDKIDIIKPIIPIKPIRAPKFAAMRSMAEYPIPTPVTRKEMYLNVIAGGISELPTPKTREELYLAKICGQDVDIPIPLTRYEMYLYKLAGGEWDVPEPKTRLEVFLYHNLGFEVETPEPVTREEIYWNGGQPQPKTTEGIPPLTFTAKRTGNLENYTIYGNTSQNGTPTPDNPVEVVGVGDEVKITLSEPLRAIGEYKDTLDLSTGVVTRRIKKWVFDGSEGWAYAQMGYTLATRSILNTPDDISQNLYRVVNTHYSSMDSWLSGATKVGLSYKGYDVPGTSRGHRVCIGVQPLDGTDMPKQADIDALVSFLQQQYSNGTPVTVWYVLATPTTETVSVPSGMTGIIEGYLTQDGTPTPDNPIYPESNGEKQLDGTYLISTGKYALPITCANQTNTIYLSEPLHKIGDYADELNFATGQVTRRIGKYVVTGNEDIRFTEASSSAFRNVFYFYGKYLAEYINGAPIGTHFSFSFDWSDLPYRMSNNTYGLRAYLSYLTWFFSVASNDFNSQEEFVNYCKSQYNNGTPFTIYYALATPVTEQITLPEIPTVAGENTLTVGTTVQPSNVSITYK